MLCTCNSSFFILLLCVYFITQFSCQQCEYYILLIILYRVVEPVQDRFSIGFHSIESISYSFRARQSLLNRERCFNIDTGLRRRILYRYIWYRVDSIPFSIPIRESISGCVKDRRNSCRTRAKRGFYGVPEGF